MSRTDAIDVHCHVCPADFPPHPGHGDGTRWPAMRCEHGGHRTVVIGGRDFRRLDASSWDAGRRLADMDAAGIGMQVLSPMPELLSYWLELGDAEAMAAHVNGTIAELVAAAPRRFAGLGMVPLQDPERAARAVARLRSDHGLVGVEVGSNVNGVPIGDRRFDPFFAACEEAGMAVFVHALHPVRERLTGPPLMEALVAFPQETALAIASCIVSAVPERFPRLRIAFSHGGGAFAAVAPRLQHGWETAPPVREAIAPAPLEQARRFWYDTLVYDAGLLAYLVGLYGRERLLIGTDYPYVIRERDPVARIDALRPDPALREALLAGNARRFLALDQAG